MLGRPRRCPACHGPTVYASRSGWLRRLARLILLRPYRCWHCHHRVWRFSLAPGPERPSKAG